MKFGYRTNKYIGACIVLTLFGMIYFYASPAGTPWTGKDSHLLNLSLGAFGGFFVLLIQFIIDGSRDKALEDLQQQKIVRVHPSRDDEQYYAKLIEATTKEIIVCGVTASRFMNDFVDIESPRQDRRIVIAAIARGVSVRILVASADKLDDEERKKADAMKSKFLLMQKDYPGKFSVRKYDHQPTFSLTAMDDNCLFGPVFPNRKSKNSATIHALRGGYIANLYMEQFEHEWNKATAF